MYKYKSYIRLAYWSIVKVIGLPVGLTYEVKLQRMEMASVTNASL